MWDRNQQLTWRASFGGVTQSRNEMTRLDLAPDARSTPGFEPNPGILPSLLRSFGLKQQPFGVTPDPSFLYLSQTHREALASLVYGIETGRGFLALIAQPGMGKTTLLFHLLEQFRSSARTAFVFQTQCTSREFLQFLSSDLGCTTSSSQDFVRMIEEFNYHLSEEARVGKRFIVVVDEAQNLSSSVLETIRLLSNFETPRAKLLQIVLSGQPELGNKLARHDMVQLQQRISSLNRLEPFSLQEIEQYIQHRLWVAGYSGGALLTSDALAIAADFSAGIPRKINNFCFNALSLAFATQQQTIDATIAREVVGDLEVAMYRSQPHRVPENESNHNSDPSQHTSELNQGTRDTINGGLQVSLPPLQVNEEDNNKAIGGSHVSLPASELAHISDKQVGALPFRHLTQTQTGPGGECTTRSRKPDYPSMPLAQAKEYMNTFIRSLKSSPPESGR
jgi:type II secretory pathway predicted ATPase ExeA